MATRAHGSRGGTPMQWSGAPRVRSGSRRRSPGPAGATAGPSGESVVGPLPGYLPNPTLTVGSHEPRAVDRAPDPPRRGPAPGPGSSRDPARRDPAGRADAAEHGPGPGRGPHRGGPAPECLGRVPPIPVGGLFGQRVLLRGCRAGRPGHRPAHLRQQHQPEREHLAQRERGPVHRLPPWRRAPGRQGGPGRRPTRRSWTRDSSRPSPPPTCSSTR